MFLVFQFQKESTPKEVATCPLDKLPRFGEMLSPNKYMPQMTSAMTSVEQEAQLLDSTHDNFLIDLPKQAPLQPFSDIHSIQNAFYETPVQTYDQPQSQSLSEIQSQPTIDLQHQLQTSIDSQPPQQIENLPSFSTINVPSATTQEINDQREEQKTYSDDIMNMDIIFEDMPLEVQQTIDPVDVHNLPSISDAPIDENPIVLDSTKTNPIDCNDFVLSGNDIMIIRSQDNEINTNLPTTAIVSPDDSWAVQSEINEARTQPMTVEKIENVPQTEVISKELVSNIPILQNNEKQEKQTQLNPVAETNVKSEDDKSSVIVINSQPTVEKVNDEKLSIAPKLPEPIKHRRRPAPILVDRNRKSTSKKNDPNVTKPIAPPKIEEQTETVETDNTQPANSNVPECPIQENETNDTKTDENYDNFLYSLVIVESQDENDKNKTVCKVYYVCPETKKMSNQPLDLPEDVIQRIRRIRSSENIT